ncbi:MAG: hypothetical protein KAX05_15330 [Bacteroidales bacterium]|nr:hypothetical protein [Bacteroidales bacterium]
MKKLIPIIFTILIAIPVFAGDVVTLTNNKSFYGKVKKIENTTVKFKADGKTYFIPADDIYSIVFENENDKVLQAYLLLDDREKCFKGGQDASLFHGKAVGHFVLGAIFGPFAVVGAAIANPTPDRGSKTFMMSKNRDLFDDPAYLECYIRKAKGKNVIHTAIGWATWVIVGVLSL